MLRRGLLLLGLVGSGCGLVGYEPSDDDGTARCALRSIAAGGDHTCVVDARGAVWCWGGDGAGETTGARSGTPTTSPALLVLPVPALAVTAGVDSSCALVEEGRVYCWGALGDDGAPVEVVLPGVAHHVAAGGGFACAIVGDESEVVCWGKAEYGQLGQGDAVDHPKPVRVPGTAGALVLAVGPVAACVATAAATRCWGRNNHGQLGNGRAEELSGPDPVLTLGGAEAIALGLEFTCAVDEGDLRCWGHNDRGQLATTGGTTMMPGPPIARDVHAIAAMASSACLKDASGQVSCWGRNHGGQLGQDDLARRAAPAPIAAFTGATALTAGEGHACAEVDSQLWCWGENDDGQLGRGTIAIAWTPRVIAADQSFTAVSVGDTNICAVEATTGALRCWGDNEYAQAGDGTVDGIPAPTAAAPVPAIASGVGDVALGAYHGCAYEAATGDVRCWGQNYTGQIGDDTFDERRTPQLILQLGAVGAVAAGFSHGCAIDGGAMKCWGSNSQGQLGDGTTTESPRPLKVVLPDDAPAVSIACGKGPGAGHTCGVSDAGMLQCWGNNSDGQLGIDTGGAAPPMGNIVLHPTAGQRWVSVAAGEAHTCAIDDVHDIYCWGDNLHGQAGPGDGSDVFRPQRITDDRIALQAKRIHAHWDTTCVILMNDDAYCWGLGVLGTTETLTPVRFGALDKVRDFGGSFYDLCAVALDGALWCSGLGSHGQLGLDLVGTPAAATFSPADDPWTCP